MTGPQSGPELSVVQASEPADAPEKPARSEDPEAAPIAPEASESGSSLLGRRVPLWAVLLVLAVGVVLAGGQFRRAESLEAQVIGLETELARLGSELAAYESHLESVRAAVGDLSARMGRLDSLVNSDPLLPVAEEETPLETPAETVLPFDAIDGPAEPGVSAPQPDALP